MATWSTYEDPGLAVGGGPKGKREQEKKTVWVTGKGGRVCPPVTIKAPTLIDVARIRCFALSFPHPPL